MNKSFLYIGQADEGSTSRMRANCLQNVLEGSDCQIINTKTPFDSLPRLWRSLGFRFKVGAIIGAVNQFIIDQLADDTMFDLIWIDKNIFIRESTIKFLRSRGRKLIHFTPDCAFYVNRSRYFERSIQYFDYLVTTKSFEISSYEKIVPSSRVILVNQGFDPSIHQPYHTFDEKDDSVVFIGLYESYRGKILGFLISNGIKVKVGGKNWEQFARTHSNADNFVYLGDRNYGEDYVKHISSSKFGIGLLSRKFPELHTTRTIEIPACGTALLTERNIETERLFGNDEAIFYSSENELLEKIRYYFLNQEQLKELIEKGNKRVNQSGYDYQSLVRRIVNRINGLEQI